MYADGGGLYLHVSPTGAKSWILRTVIHGKRRDLGCGSADLVTLAEAREAARKLRKVAREGGDPARERKRQTLTFEVAARRVHTNLLPTWTNAHFGKTWLSSLENDVFPHIGSRQLQSVTTADLLSVLQPIWTVKADTAKKIKQRIAAVFDWAKGAGHFAGENPVLGLKKALPTMKATGAHYDAMPWPDLPAFLKVLHQRDGMSARCLEFIILTCVRSGEARGARWSEIQGNVWTIPAERMKAREVHRVPLTPEALAVLDRVRGLDDELIFPSSQKGKDGRAKEQSDMVFIALYKRMEVEGFTTHGFRSTFRDWCGESARADREVAEAALAHSVGNAVERAYARSDLFDRRRELMVQWSTYAKGTKKEVASDN
ncbi:integrase [Cypionkella aquatica]|uniref:Integrase n=2 Tax=Cypionkella aquatica TaxID=1756042 RepID=A0AA37U7E6_9RHOB|nr:integrase [Cypionkella aquatica]